MSNKMELTRTVPAHDKTMRAKWCKLNYKKMSKKFRNIVKYGRSNLISCYWCKRPHEDGEMMALACFAYIGDRTLCQKCAAELLSGDDDA